MSGSRPKDVLAQALGELRASVPRNGRQRRRTMQITDTDRRQQWIGFCVKFGIPLDRADEAFEAAKAIFWGTPKRPPMVT